MDDVEAAGGYVEYENIYADLCHVGAKQDALKQLLQDVAAKGYKAVVVSDPSRISRKVYEIVEVASIFVEQGAKLYFISDREIVEPDRLRLAWFFYFLFHFYFISFFNKKDIICLCGLLVLVQRKETSHFPIGVSQMEELTIDICNDYRKKGKELRDQDNPQFMGARRALVMELRDRCGIPEIWAMNIISGLHSSDYLALIEFWKKGGAEKKKSKDSLEDQEYQNWLIEKEANEQLELMLLLDEQSQ